MNRLLSGCMLIACMLMSQQASALVIHAPWLYTVASTELIVAGKVVEVDVAGERHRRAWFSEEKPNPTLKLLVDDVIVGDCEVGRKLEVYQLRHDNCHPYLTFFTVGERVVLFLDRGDAGDSVYRVRDESRLVTVDGDQEYAADINDSGQVNWRNTFPYRDYRTAIADFRVSYRFVFMPEPIDANEDAIASLLPCSRIDFVSSQPASTSFRKRYPPGVAPAITPFKDRSSVHEMLFERVQTERRRIKQHQAEIERASKVMSPAI